MTTPQVAPQEILDFWFGPLDARGWSGQDRMSRWFKKNPDFDAELRQRFLSTHTWLHASHAEGSSPWHADAPSLMAYIIVLDQMSRNMFRGTADMFRSDPLALAASKLAIDQSWDKQAPSSHRVFMYMPLMHSEALADQELCIRCFEGMHKDLEADDKARVESNLHFAKQHRDIVQRFGRFPHRNEILHRSSSPEEIEFLTQPGSSF